MRRYFFVGLLGEWGLNKFLCAFCQGGLKVWC